MSDCDPMDCSMPGFPVLQYLLGFAQTHVYWADGAIQPSHPLLPLSLHALNLSQSQCLFQWVSCSHRGAKSIGASASVLPMNILGWFLLGLTGLISLKSKRFSGIFSSTTVGKHQFFGALPFLWRCSHNQTGPLGGPQPWLTDLCWQSDVFAF